MAQEARTKSPLAAFRRLIRRNNRTTRALPPAEFGTSAEIDEPAKPDPDVPEEAAAEGASLEATFSEAGNTQTLAENTQRLFWDPERWIYRRVERITFLDRGLVRRRISVDFKVPAARLDLPEEMADDGQYVPISVLRSWPPVHNFDLRDSRGNPLTLLSKSTTNDLDEKVLQGMAAYAMGDAAPEVFAQLHEIVHREGAGARRAHQVLREGIEEHIRKDGSKDGVERYSRFLDTAGLLCDSTILWIYVRAEVDERMLVKLAYDEPIRRRLLGFRGGLTAFGWRSLVVAFDVPHIGDANSYHLEIEAPPGMEMAGARLDLSSDDAAQGVFRRAAERVAAAAHLVAGTLASVFRSVPSDAALPDLHRNVDLLTGRAHLYVTGDRSRAFGLATIKLLPARWPILGSAFATTALLAASLMAFHSVADDVYRAATAAPSNSAPFSGAVAFLLLAPGLLVYVLLRGDEHHLLSRTVGGVRLLAVSAVLATVSTAGVLIRAVATKEPDLLQCWSLWGMRVACAIAALLLVSALFPLRRSWRRSD